MVKINIIRGQQTAGPGCSTKRKSESSGVSIEDAAGKSFADIAIAAVKAEMSHFEIDYDAERTSKDDDDQIIVSIYIGDDDNGDRVADEVADALKGGISAHLPSAEYEVDTVTEDDGMTLFIVAFNVTPEE